MNQRESQLLAEWREAERVPFVGWDFSALGPDLVPATQPWSYADIVRQAIRRSRSVLDLGTGGGEFLFSVRDAFPAAVSATEGYAPNLELARSRLAPVGVRVEEATNSLNATLPFDSAEFDLVIDRHTAFNAKEVARVLTPQGSFITQQVNGMCEAELLRVFGSEPKWPFFTLQYLVQLLEPAGFTVLDAREDESPTRFKSVAALVRYIVATPWYVEGFCVDAHADALLALQATLDKGQELAYPARIMFINARAG
jgi:SAM-dependent methyltransferase